MYPFPLNSSKVNTRITSIALVCAILWLGPSSDFMDPRYVTLFTVSSLAPVTLVSSILLSHHIKIYLCSSTFFVCFRRPIFHFVGLGGFVKTINYSCKLLVLSKDSSNVVSESDSYSTSNADVPTYKGNLSFLPKHGFF